MRAAASSLRAVKSHATEMMQFRTLFETGATIFSKKFFGIFPVQLVNPDSSVEAAARRDGLCHRLVARAVDRAVDGHGRLGKQ